MPFAIDANAIAAAATPEDAAQIFKQVLTKALAEAAAQALSSALAAKPFAANPALAGWEDFVGGVHMDVFWAKPATAKSTLVQSAYYSPVAGAAGTLLLGGFEVGVSIKGTL